MAAAVKLQTDFTTWDLRRLAAASKHANQRRRRLSLPRTQFQHHHSEGLNRPGFTGGHLV